MCYSVYGLKAGQQTYLDYYSQTEQTFDKINLHFYSMKSLNRGQ